jgi:hypothetical protein
VLLVGLLFSGAAFADHPDTLGVGGVIGGGFAFDFTGYDSVWGFGYPGFSLKIPKIPIFWAFYANLALGRDLTGLGFTADYYVFEKDLVAQELTNEDGSYDFKLDLYIGVGLFFDFLFNSIVADFDVGVRVPVGVSWHIIKELELFTAVGPALGFYTGSVADPRFHSYIFGELGLRYWLK